MSATTRRSDVQGLRAIAVLFVVIFHAGLSLPGGFTGVDIFFVISGFVITGTLVRELESEGRLDISGFYIRRIKRLLPALAVMLVAVSLLGILASPVSSISTSAYTGVFASLFSANAYLYHLGGGGYFDASASLNPLLHTWTLGVEEQFYVVFPVLLLLSWLVARRLRDRRRIVVLVVVAGASVVSLALAFRAPQTFAFYGSPARAWEFGAGALVSLLAPAIARIPRALARIIGALGVVALVVTGVETSEANGLPSAAVLPVGGTCALLVAGTIAITGVSKLLAARPLGWIGDRSYGWYLWHWPAIVFATALWPLSDWAPPIAALVSLLPAAASYRYVENPIRHNPRIRAPAAAGLGAVCVVVPLLACVTWRAGVQHLTQSSPALAAVRASEARSVGETRGCFGAFDPGTPATDRCTWKPAGSRRVAVLVGDSTATTLTGAFAAAANSARLTAVSSTLPGCAFADLFIRGGFQTETTCRAYYVESLHKLVRARPALVVLANTSTDVRSDVEPDTIALGVAGAPARTTQPSERQRLWAIGRASAIRQLNDAGIPVLIILPTPITTVTPSSCAVLRVL